MADSPNTLTASAIPQSPSRRNIIAAGAAAGAGDDPIFAALAEWRRLNAVHDATEEDTAERHAALDALVDFERETLFPLKPTSMAGVVAMLKFIADPKLALLTDDVSAVVHSSIEFLEREALS